jgi:flagellar basal-body rod modification protein FlgD
MNSTDSINALATQNVASSAAKARDRLDQKSFLQLMIAQFRNQDPTKPQDPAQFLGQLAQFSTVSGIQDMQGSIGSLSDSLRSSNVLSGAILVGHSILAPHDVATRGATENVSGAIDVPPGTTSIQVTVKDAAGQLVRRFDVPAYEGLSEFSWDGVTDRGEAAAAGTYKFAAEARVLGKNESVPILLNTKVDSVTIDPTTNNLVLNTRGIGAVAMSDVRRVM